MNGWTSQSPRREVPGAEARAQRGTARAVQAWRWPVGATSRGACRGRSPVGDRPSGPVRKIEAPLANPRGTGAAVAATGRRLTKMDASGLHRARGGRSTVLAGQNRPVAKKEARAIAHGSQLGFTTNEAARGREVGRRAGPEGANTVAFKSHRQKASESRACGPVEADAPGYVGGPALGAGRLRVTPGSEGPQASPPRRRRRSVLLLSRRGSGISLF